MTSALGGAGMVQWREHLSTQGLRFDYWTWCHKWVESVADSHPNGPSGSSLVFWISPLLKTNFSKF